MRKDESGNTCPETLKEYRDLCVAISPHGDKCRAVGHLDAIIKKNGENNKVIASDLAMRTFLMPLCLEREDA